MMAVVESGNSLETGRADAGVSPRFGPMLALWMALILALNGVLWVAGFRTSGLVEAVEWGAAQVETRGIGEVSDDLIRRAIQTQHDTLPFWTTLARLADFLAEPLALAVRAVAAATAFAAVAALAGRPIRFEEGLAACAREQGFWVLGLAVQVGLMVALRRADVETSPALFLPPGTYPAGAWLALRQLDAFALLGWSALARGAWRRGQVGPAGAIVLCAGLALGEAAVRVASALMIGSATRLEIVPA
jgi:hypothetical protein